MRLVDREDSQLAIPGRDLHGVREGRAWRVSDTLQPVLYGQVDSFQPCAFVESVALRVELLPGVEAEALDVFQDPKGSASLVDGGGYEAQFGSVVGDPSYRGEHDVFVEVANLGIGEESPTLAEPFWH
eukprot:12240027-Heterocapsa_arctica.AAC.1